MSLFCFLWLPLFYLFRRTIGAGEGGSGGIWAFLLGIAAAVLQSSFGPLVNPAGFGFSRWLSGFVDIVSLPALIPLIVCLLFTVFRLVSETPDFAGFTLLWLIPAGALRPADWGALNDPILLVAVPLLWTAIAVGIPFFFPRISSGRLPAIALSAFGILALLVLASAAYWAFFSQKTGLGFFLLFVSLIPAGVSTGFSVIKNV
jgi:hypothetical protein